MNSEEAEQKAEQWKREGEARLNQRSEVIHVKVDNEAITETINENKKLKQEIEESTDAKELLIQLKENASVELTALGINTEVEDLKSKADLDRAISTIQKLKAKQGSHREPQINAGCVPLSSQQTQNPQAFGTHEEMIDSIRDRASTQNPDKQDRANAKAVLDKLFEKSLKGQSEAHKPFSYEMGKETSLSDMLSEKYRRRKNLGKRE
jgi:hypothetical protein